MSVGNSIASQTMSIFGQTGIMVGFFDLPAGSRFNWHDHREHQLMWASRGVLAVTTADGTWVLPPTRAVWLPAGTRHLTGASTPAIVRSLRLEPGTCPLTFDAPTAVTVDDLLRSLIHHLARTDLAASARARAEAVVYDVIAPAQVGTIRVVLPRDARALQVAQLLMADPADDRDLAGWGREVGASARTLARLFASETGLSFGRWRTQVRMRAALIQLAAGTPVGTVAHRVGYRAPSAFVAAFRQALGAPPGSYFTR